MDHSTMSQDDDEVNVADIALVGKLSNIDDAYSGSHPLLDTRAIS